SVVDAPIWRIIYSVFFFFQAEDGIRDRNVTGVQTCALPICTRTVPAPSWAGRRPRTRLAAQRHHHAPQRKNRRRHGHHHPVGCRSEERRVGKEGRGRWSRRQERKRRALERCTTARQRRDVWQ